MTLARKAENYFRVIRARLRMEKNYYLKSFVIALFIFCMSVSVFKSSDKAVIIILICGVNALLFPLARRAVENVVFRFTGKDFWGTDPLRAAASYGGHVLLWTFYFVFAIALGTLYLLWLCLKK
ncbi:colicin E1 family microcin immunity protein [Pseudomonas antarctica]|uniref:Colicin E1 (Microcin) immunity protein n=1 Tax=Pseudomonas antarctica TaxID=219572 RepID=A0A1H0D8H5_9PSED|nr:colicin E1 family microcin immunity protein [Pseudomonas antarctica]KAF2405672.1 hypothetical protein PSAN_58430 [Pseudomonas antarctica]SDN66408.1 Colicin E1 (microcin) immunity protein [Pseudomonas antarctica]